MLFAEQIIKIILAVQLSFLRFPIDGSSGKCLLGLTDPKHDI